METITLQNLFKELKGQTFVEAANVVFSNGSSATVQKAQVYMNDNLFIQNKTAHMALTITSIAEIMVNRIDLGDGLIINAMFIILK